MSNISPSDQSNIFFWEGLQLLERVQRQSCEELLLECALKKGDHSLCTSLVDYDTSFEKIQDKDLLRKLFNRACEIKNIKLIQRTFQREFTVNILVNESNFQESPLWCAWQLNKWDTTNSILSRLILEKGADSSFLPKSIAGEILLFSCQYLHSSVAIQLIDQGAGMECVDDKGNTPLLLTCDSGDEVIAAKLIAKGANIEHVNGKGNTPLLVACSKEHDGIVAQLIEKDANIECMDEDGDTPLLLACYYGYKEIAKQLIVKDANIECRNEDGWTPLMVACSQDHGKIVVQLIAKGANIECVSNDGDTPFMVVCRNGYSAIVAKFLEKDCNIEYVDCKGDTPFLIACGGNYEDIVAQLIAKGANIECVDRHGDTALMVACRKGYKGIVAQLIAKDANIEHVNNEGDSSLLLACAHGHMQIMIELLEKQADIINFANKAGETAVMIACRKGNMVILDMLIKKKANLDHLNKKGDTALVYSLQHCQDSYGEEDTFSLITQLLITSGADLKKTALRTTLSGNTLFHLACQDGNPNIIDRFIQAMDIKTMLLPKNYLQDRPQEMLVRSEEALNSSGRYNVLRKLLKKTLTLSPEFVDECQTAAELFTKVKKLSSDTQSALEYADPISEIALLFQDFSIMRQLFKILSKDIWDATVGKIAAKYGRTAADDVELNVRYEVNHMHLGKQLRDPKIPKKPENSSVDDWLKIFDEMNFSDPQKPEYYRPEGSRSQAELRQILVIGFLDIIKQKKVYLGTPEKEPALTEFYEVIENAICHVAYYLNNLPNNEDTRALKASTVLNLLRSAGFCGPRISMTATGLYDDIVFNIKPTHENKTLHSLGEFRSQVSELLAPPGSQSLHSYSTIMKELGGKFGLPKSAMISQSEDRLAKRIHRAEIEKAFFRVYSASAIIPWISSEVNRSRESKDACIDWMKAHIPDNFEKEKFDKIRSNVKEMTDFRAIEAMLRDNEIYVGKDQNFEQAIEAAYVSDYLATVVDENTGKICDSAIVGSLIALDVLSCCVITFDSNFPKTAKSCPVIGLERGV